MALLESLRPARRPSPPWRALRLACLSAAPAVLVPEGAPRPPSLQRAPAATVRVNIVHRHQRVRGCKTEAEVRCVPIMAEASGAATLRFLLLEPPNTLDGPSVVTAELRDAIGEQSTSAELAAGRWSVAWVGAAVGGRLDLTSGRPPSIALETISGRCTRREDRCILQDGPRSRTLAVSQR